MDFDWRVDVKISSDSVARMAQPTCLVQMKVSMISLQDNVLSLNFRLHPTCDEVYENFLENERAREEPRSVC